MKDYNPWMEQELLKGMQSLHPWLVRTCVDDVDFARILKHLLVIIPIEDSDYDDENGYNMSNVFATIEKAEKINLGENASIDGPIYAYFILWFRYVCLCNKNFYNSILASTFDKSDIKETKTQKKNFVCSRLKPLGLHDEQIDDAYYILKGYLDAMLSVASYTADWIREQFPRVDDLAMFDKIAKSHAGELDEKYPITESVRGGMSLEEMQEIFLRDYLRVKDVSIE